MSGVHLVVTKNNKFSDIPKVDFYFEKLNNLKKSLEILKENNFNYNLFLDIDVLTEEELDSILSINKRYKIKIVNKKEKYEYYKKEIEEKI